MEIRPFGASDGRAMQELQSRIWPLGLHPGGLGWLLATEQLGQQIVVAIDRGNLVGWSAFSPPGELIVQIAPGARSAADALLESLDQRAAGTELSLAVGDADSTLREAVLEHGFTAGDTVTHGMWMDAMSAGPGVEGYDVRPVSRDEYDERVEVHRAAWRPAELPFHPDHRPVIDEEAVSSFSKDVYARCRDTWLYEPDLDLVAVAPDGSLAATCLAWLDPFTGVAELEPMGVHPTHRRRGLAGVLCHEVAWRVQQMGGSEVFINAGPREDYPAPAAYTKAGFRTVRRGQTYVRRASSGPPP